MNIALNHPELKSQKETQGETTEGGTATETVVTVEQPPPTENIQ